MQTSVIGAIVGAVLLAVLVFWLRLVKPKRDKAKQEAQAKLEASIRKAEAAKCRDLMEQILPVLSAEPKNIEAIVAAVELASGASLSSSEVPKALAWELGRQTRCRIARQAEKGFTLKSAKPDRANA